MSKAKNTTLTREQAEKRLERAVSGSRRLGLEDVADRYESMTVDDYANEKGLTLINPAARDQSQHAQRRTSIMASTTGELENELEEVETDVDEAVETITAVWELLIDVDEKTNKAAMLEAINAALDVISDYDPDTFDFDEDDETTE